MNRPARRYWLTMIACAVVSASPLACADPTEDASAVVDKARIAFEDVVKTKDYDTLRSALKSAKGVLIFPSIIKAGLIVGGSGGTGVLLVRGEGNDWSHPAFYALGALSVGLQIGGQTAEVVILANSQKAIDSLLSNSVKLGGEVSIAVGPKGTGRAADLTADFLSYVKSRGAFAGVSIEGSVLDVRDTLNHAYYGKAVTPAEILVLGNVANAQATALRAAVAAVAR